MKCVICNGTEIETREVDEEIRFGGDIFLVPMQLLVCLNCGERYYDRKALKKLEKMRALIKEKRVDSKEIGRILRIQAA
jgi:YgiT-type zinc finger domain-containing protein